MMGRDEIRFECVRDATIEAFEREFPLPPEVARPRVLKLSESPPAIIQLILDHGTWLALSGIGGVIWFGKRVTVFIDEFSKGFAGEAGKDSYRTLKDLLRSLRAEQPASATAADRLGVAWAAAESSEGRPVELVFGMPLGEGSEDNTRVWASNEMEHSEMALAFFAMHEAIMRSANRVKETHTLTFNEVNATIEPYGFRLQWIEEPWRKTWQAFAPDGTSLNEPSEVPPETREEILALRENLIKTLPEEKRQAAIDAFARHDRESDNS